MQAANGVFTCFRSVERLIGSEVAGTSGAHHACFDRIISAATWSSKRAACQPHTGSFSTPAYLLQFITKHCTNSPAVARHLVGNARTSPAGSFRWHGLLSNIQKNTFRQQHSFKTETSAKSLWQQGYNTPGFGYRRSYSIWDGDNVLYGLIAANLAGFLLWQSYPGLMYRHATVSVNSVREGRVYTLLTSAFSHNAFNHILANMVTFYFFGRSMSRILGGKKVCRFRQLHTSCCFLFKLLLALPLNQLHALPLQLLLLYMAGGLAGSLAHVTQCYIQAQSTGKPSPDVLCTCRCHCRVPEPAVPHLITVQASSLADLQQTSHIMHLQHKLTWSRRGYLSSPWSIKVHGAVLHCMALHYCTVLHCTAS